jgi:hypothetical protein
VRHPRNALDLRGIAATNVRRRLTLRVVAFWWADEDADYIRSRSSRYADPVDLKPEWTQQVIADEHALELSPYPTSRVRASAFSAGHARRGGSSS